MVQTGVPKNTGKGTVETHNIMQHSYGLWIHTNFENKEVKGRDMSKVTVHNA